MLWEHIKRCMAKYPYKTISECGSAITYEESVIFAESFAKNLNAPCYGVLCRSQIGAALALLSCFAADKTAMPLSFKTGEMKCETFFEMIKPPFVITDVGGEIQAVNINRGEYRHPKSDPAVIICTRGYDGFARCISLSHSNILSALTDRYCFTDAGEGTKMFIAKSLCQEKVLIYDFLKSLVNGCDIEFIANGVFSHECINLK